jgi:hypothetical protein
MGGVEQSVHSSRFRAPHEENFRKKLQRVHFLKVLLPTPWLLSRFESLRQAQRERSARPSGASGIASDVQTMER